MGNHLVNILKSTNLGADPGFPNRGTDPKGRQPLANVSRKLHENEEMTVKSRKFHNPGR